MSSFAASDIFSTVAVSTGNVAQLKPGERAETWATADAAAPAVRFACKVGVSEWQRPN